MVAILNSAGTAVVNYTYDAWGKLLSTTGSMASTLGLHNPLRYRGYVYDRETGLYYLQSRYYNPEWGRFINADGNIGIEEDLVSYNMFAYCKNQPISGICVCISGNQGYGNAESAGMGMSTTNSRTSSTLLTHVSSSFSFANHVNRLHATTPTVMLDLGLLLGKVGFSSTLTKQNKEPGFFYSYSDIGNDTDKYGVGLNLVGWLGLSAGVSSSINLFANAQITPWVHFEASVGFDGVGVLIGIDVEDISYDFEIKGGWGLLIALLAPEALAGLGLSGAAIAR